VKTPAAVAAKLRAGAGDVGVTGMTALGSDGSMYEGSRRSVIGHLPGRVSADDVALKLVALAACRIGHRPAGRRKRGRWTVWRRRHPLHRLTV